MNTLKRESLNLVTKEGVELTDDEVDQIKVSLFREFKVTVSKDILHDKLFFLLKNKIEILAMGGLWEVKPFIFDGINYTMRGVVEVVANEKGKGFGKRVMIAIREYLVKNNFTGFGFCMPKNQEFYKKCGFQIASGITHRFIYHHEGKNITNQDGQIIFYQDSSDQLLTKVLADPSKEVAIPTEGLW